MNYDDIKYVLQFQNDLIELLKEQYKFNYGSYDNFNDYLNPEIIATLIQEQVLFLEQGCYSTCYFTQDKKRVYSVNNVTDSAKIDILYNLSDLPHIPNIEILGEDTDSDYRLLVQPYVTVLKYYEMTERQKEIYDIITSYYDISSIYYAIENNDVDVISLPQSLKDTFKAVYDINNYVDFDTKPSNIGWDENGDIVLFDLFLM